MRILSLLLTVILIVLVVAGIVALVLHEELTPPPIIATTHAPAAHGSPAAAIFHSMFWTGKPGAASEVGCNDGLWAHVYNPSRLTVYNDCITVGGTIVDATDGRRKDGVRKERDGDTHGWIHLDPPYANLLDDGNKSNEDGNLVFEIVCHWRPSQPDAVSSCPADEEENQALPPVGAHVAITGTYVEDENHQHWMEIHPVSKIEVK